MKYIILFLILAISVTAIPYDLIDLKMNISLTNENGTTHIRSDCNYDLAINESKNVTCNFQRFIEYRNFSFNLNAPSPIIQNNITLNEKNVTCQAPTIDMNYEKVSEICANMSKEQYDKSFYNANITCQESISSKNSIIFTLSILLFLTIGVISILVIHERKTHKKVVIDDEPKPNEQKPIEPKPNERGKFDDFLE